MRYKIIVASYVWGEGDKTWWEKQLDYLKSKGIKPMTILLA